METNSTIEINGREFKCRTREQINEFIKFRESEARNLAAKRAGANLVLESEVVEDYDSETNAKIINDYFNNEANAKMIDSYNKEHRLGKYWVGIPSLTQLQYSKKGIKDLSKNFGALHVN